MFQNIQAKNTSKRNSQNPKSQKEIKIEITNKSVLVLEVSRRSEVPNLVMFQNILVVRSK